MKAFAIASPCVLLVLSACHPIRIKTDYNPKANLAALRTYAWQQADPTLDTGDPRFDTRQIGREIRAVVDAALAAKGLHHADPAGADFLIGYRGDLSSGSSTVTRQRRLDDTKGLWGFTGTSSVDYDTGILILEMTDPRTREMLWRAGASTVVIEQATAAERRERIRKTVQKMIDKFPPD